MEREKRIIYQITKVFRNIIKEWGTLSVTGKKS